MSAQERAELSDQGAFRRRPGEPRGRVAGLGEEYVQRREREWPATVPRMVPMRVQR